MTFRQWLCSHRDAMKLCSQRRVFIECLTCGYQSPGITTGPPADAVKKLGKVIQMNLRAGSLVSYGVSDRQDLPRQVAR